MQPLTPLSFLAECSPVWLVMAGLLGLLAPLPATADSASLPADLPDFHWHLTARPWQPVAAQRGDWLDQMDRAMHALAPCQYWNSSRPADPTNGAIIDPYDHREIQYGTPMFAFNVGVLVAEDRAVDLLTNGVRALDRAALNIATGFANDGHGEFFCAPMAKAIRLYASLQPKYPEVITPERLRTWQERMRTPRAAFMHLNVRQNWRTFAMKGEWLRQRDGYITDGVPWIELCWTNWIEGSQRARFLSDRDDYHLDPYFFLYHDSRPAGATAPAGGASYSGADPQTYAYNGAASANLLDMLVNGYDGPSANEMRALLSRDLRASLLLLSGSGEAPAGGRTGEHGWDDTIYASAFAKMAGEVSRQGNTRLAGEFRHAARLLLQSHARFQQESGLFSITKNLYPLAWKNHYASWSGVANYEGFDLACLAEAVLADRSGVAEQPVPSEIGGYAVVLDPSFASVFLDAGGLQAQLCTRGETDNYGLVQWHTLGITRFSRVGWDGRLGPGAGGVNSDFSDGVSFAPVFFENGKWTPVYLEPKRFEGRFQPEFVHPLLVRGTYTIAPVAGQSGPSFALHLALTPDGAIVDTERVSGTNGFGVVWPLLRFDGQTVLNQSLGGAVASTAYPLMAGRPQTLPVTAARLVGGAALVNEGPGQGDARFISLSARGAGVQWTNVPGGTGGPATIGFHYVLVSKTNETQRAKLTVNGLAQPDLTFLSTGENGFSHVLNMSVTLAAGGGNTIRLECADEAGVRVDELRVYPAEVAEPVPDQENFIALKTTHHLEASGSPVRGGYGDFLPIRVTDDAGGRVETLVYPRGAGDPPAEMVRASFRRSGPDFSSVLGWVRGTLYAGRTSAGGVGREIDLAGDGRNVVRFNESCAFILQLSERRVIAVEADRPVTATIAGRTIPLAAYEPVRFK